VAWVPLEPARPQPAASSAATVAAEMILIQTLTGFLLADAPAYSQKK
jgi:hypothetical protein